MTPDEIKELRNRFNISQDRFAAILGVTPLSVRRWEAGKARPSPMAQAALKKIARRKELGV